MKANIFSFGKLVSRQEINGELLLNDMNNEEITIDTKQGRFHIKDHEDGIKIYLESEIVFASRCKNLSGQEKARLSDVYKYIKEAIDADKHDLIEVKIRHKCAECINREPKSYCYLCKGTGYIESWIPIDLIKDLKDLFLN